MKTLALIVIATLTLGCDENMWKPPPPESRIQSQGQSKKIIAKQAPIENRVSAWDTLTGDGSIRTKSKTVYYLVADDGTVAEVGLSVYTTTQIGESFTTTSWENK